MIKNEVELSPLANTKECIEMSIIVILGLIGLILSGDLIKMGGKM